ncbi:MAG: hypothetical protein GY796_36575 [Chloroflexi bacterium]|nr:hypothetical protein [Chloroflexota bacterium]
MRSQISFDKKTHPQRLARSPKSKFKNGQALKTGQVSMTAYNVPFQRTVETTLNQLDEIANQ